MTDITRRKNHATVHVTMILRAQAWQHIGPLTLTQGSAHWARTIAEQYHAGKNYSRAACMYTLAKGSCQNIIL